MPLPLQLVCKQRDKSIFPISYRFMSEGPSSFQKHLSYIAETQDASQPPEEDDIRRIFEIIEGSAGAFMKEVFTNGAAECSIAENGFLPLFFRRRRCTTWAIHESIIPH